MRAKALLAALSTLLTMALATAAAPRAPAPRAPAPTVAARTAALYDPASGALLFGRHADRRLPVGSLTKIMTALLALRRPGDTPVTAHRDVLAVPPTKADLVPGRTYPLSELLPVMIVHSANDVAIAVADGLAGSTAAFAVRMNAEASALGLRNTHYVNPNGLDAPGQYSSARDVAVLAGTAMRDAAFRRLVALRSAALPGEPAYRSLNPFLGSYPGADGIKTGYTSAAGFCLAASATHGGRELIAVVLHEPSWATAVGDAAHLLDWGFARTGAAPRKPATAHAPGAATDPAAPAAAAATPPIPPPATARESPATPAGVTAALPALAARQAVPGPQRSAPPADDTRPPMPVLAGLALAGVATSWARRRRRRR